MILYFDVKSVATVRKRSNRFSNELFDILFFSAGSVLNVWSYQSFSSFYAAFIVYVLGFYFVLFSRSCNSYERIIFSKMFSVCWFMAGVSAIYASEFNDSVQLMGDASLFYDLSSGKESADFSLIYEGSIIIWLWGIIYDLFASIGFERERYIGILVNILAVTYAAVLVIKMVYIIYGNDHYRMKRMVYLCASCGLLWMFSSIHIRDSIVLLTVTLNVYMWVVFLSRPEFGFYFMLLLLFSMVFGVVFSFMRTEFVFVPLAISIAGISALMLGVKSKVSKVPIYALSTIGLVLSISVLMFYFDDVQQYLFKGGESYTAHAVEKSGKSSLGVNLIMNQAFPLNLIFGSIYLFIFPIPFWTGFQFESVYHLFKSFNVIFFYFLIPLFISGVVTLVRNRLYKTTNLIFMILLSIGFTFSVAGTSLETRHFGAFLMPIFIVSLIPDLRDGVIKNRFNVVMMVVIISVVFIHLSWAIIKYL